MVGAILFFIGLVFTLLGLTIIPVIDLLIAVPVIIMGTIFILAPRSGACSLVVQKVRVVAKRQSDLIEKTNLKAWINNRIHAFSIVSHVD